MLRTGKPSFIICNNLPSLLEKGDDSKETKSLPKTDSLFSEKEAAETVPKIGIPGIPFN
jgi:hypothetical protein